MGFWVKCDVFWGVYERGWKARLRAGEWKSALEKRAYVIGGMVSAVMKGEWKNGTRSVPTTMNVRGAMNCATTKERGGKRAYVIGGMGVRLRVGEWKNGTRSVPTTMNVRGAMNCATTKERGWETPAAS